MRLAISNIAWDVADDAAVVDLLRQHGVDAIDVAPAKYFPKAAEASTERLAEVRRWWSDQGIEITGMQALLFGTAGFNVFGDAATQAAMLDHLGEICRIGAGLGARKIVFGSPKNRDRQGLTEDETADIASRFFRALGDRAEAHGVTICLEPNPTFYGANYMTTSLETEQVVRQIDHPAIKMQLDTGAVLINGESAAEILQTAAPLIGHIHLSEPALIPLGDGTASHMPLVHAINTYLPGMLATIEMVATKDEPPLLAVERALQFARRTYGAGVETAR